MDVNRAASMRFLRALAAFLLVLPFGSAITPPPSADELEAGEDAVLLEETYDIDIASETEARVHYTNRTRILTKKGAEEYGQASVFLNPWVTVRDLKASVVSPAGKSVAVKKQNMWEGSAFASFELFADSRHRTVNFPGAIPGAVLEYEYDTQVRNLFYLPTTFRLQDEIPIRSMTITVRLPAAMALRHAVRGPEPEYTRQEADGRVTHRWRVHDVRSYKPESDMPPPEDVLPGLSLYLKEIVWDTHRIDASTWNGIATWYHDLAKDRMVPDEEVTKTAREITQGVDDPREKIRRVYEFAQGKVEYVAIELGIGGMQPHASGDVLRHRYGDCKDKATLMIAMLRSLGLSGYPVLILTRDEGEVARDYPADHFNHVIVALPQEDGYLFADPTSEVTPFGDLPWTDQGANVLVVKDDGKGDLVETPVYEPERNRRHRQVVASIDASGNLTGTYTIEVWGQRRAQMAGFLESKPSDQADDIAEFMGWLYPGAVMVSHQVMPPARPDDPLRIVIRFEVPRFVTRAGAMELVSPYLARLPGLTRIGAYSGRRYPVFFDFLFTETSEVRLRLPAGRKLKKVPADREAKGPGLTALTKHEVVQDGPIQVLVIKRTVSVSRRQIPLADYAAAREFLSGLTQEESKAVALEPVAPTTGALSGNAGGSPEPSR